MTPLRVMVIAGEASGDILAAELVRELRAGIERHSTPSADLQPVRSSLAPKFFGAGGPCMARAGVELAFDLTQYSVVGLDMVKHFRTFKKLSDQLFALAVEREPHVIVCVDFSLFNGLFAAAIKRYVRKRRGTFNNWNPKLVKYISPQIWASREGRVYKIARDFDLLLSIFPFEKAWYSARVPKLRVEFVGHPMIDRYASTTRLLSLGDTQNPQIILLPGSRHGELKRHFPVMLEAFSKIHSAIPSAQATVILPNETLADIARHDARAVPANAAVKIQVGGLPDALARATVALASTGTVTMECAYFGVPTVTLYRASWATYQIGKRLVKVKSLTMPNLLASAPIFPEFIQTAATSANISAAALELLRDQSRREKIRARLAEIIISLGGLGASRRAAEAIIKIL